jgi:hypothetical protein
VSNELVDAFPETPADPRTVDEARAVEDVPKPALVLIRGDDDLVCIDDTCLPRDAVR